MPFSWDDYPYTNFHELNLDWFIKKFKEIFDEWNELYTTMTEWKTETETDITDWKTETEGDIEEWESGVLSDLGDWKDGFETLFNDTFSNLTDIKRDAEAARDRAEAAAVAAAGSAESIASSATQITTNTSDISTIKSALIVGNYNSTLMTDIAANTDLNSVSTPGTYRIISNDRAETLTNAPTNATAGKLIVLGLTANTRLMQLYIGIAGKIWKRAYDGTDWYAWGELYTGSQVKSAIEAVTDPIESAIEDINDNLYPLDGSLLIDNCAAESVSVTNHLSDYTIVSRQAVNSNMAMSGSANSGNITWTRTDSAKNEITINGTSTSTSVININALGATNTRPLIFGAAMETVYSKVVFNTTDNTNNIKLNILVYRSGGSYDNYLLDYDNNTALIKTDKTTTAVLCRYQLIAEGSVSNDIISFDIKMIVPHYLESTGDNTNMQRAIKRRFDLCNKCILGPGVFYTTATIDLPTGSHLIGSGNTATQIIYTGTGNAVTASYDAEISDIWIRGASEDVDISSSEGSKNGVYISGESNSATCGVLINNCTFSNFSGNGVKALNTGYPTRGFTINNCVFRNCYCGINLAKKTEYWKISNVISRVNYYGIIDNGGNNMITNSGFDSNEIGLLIDDSDGTHGNNTHGSFSNCTFNHNNTNGIKTLGTGTYLLESGMVFSNCQYFYSSINLDHVYGFGFNNCNFGSESAITINASQSVIFSNCLFRLATDSPITITNSADKIIRFFNCYTRYGTAIAENPQA